MRQAKPRDGGGDKIPQWQAIILEEQYRQGGNHRYARPGMRLAERLESLFGLPMRDTESGTNVPQPGEQHHEQYPGERVAEALAARF